MMLPERLGATKIGANLAYLAREAKEARAESKTVLNSCDILFLVVSWR
ncbi:MAG: hypothetical protein WCE62_02155 [Polyangiales bacterium]